MNFHKPYFVERWGFLPCIQWIRTLLLSYQKRLSDKMDKKIFKNSLCNTLALIWSIEPLPNVHDNSAKDREK